MIVVVALKLFVYSIRVVLHFIGIYESCIYSMNDLLVSHYIPIFQGFCSRGQLRVAGGGEFRSVNENNKSVVSYLFTWRPSSSSSSSWHHHRRPLLRVLLRVLLQLVGVLPLSSPHRHRQQRVQSHPWKR